MDVHPLMGHILVSAVLIVIVALDIRYLLSGKSGCGGNCESCGGGCSGSCSGSCSGCSHACRKSGEAAEL